MPRIDRSARRRRSNRHPAPSPCSITLLHHPTLIPPQPARCRWPASRRAVVRSWRVAARGRKGLRRGLRRLAPHYGATLRPCGSPSHLDALQPRRLSALVVGRRQPRRRAHLCRPRWCRAARGAAPHVLLRAQVGQPARDVPRLPVDVRRAHPQAAPTAVQGRRGTWSWMIDDRRRASSYSS